MKIFPRCAFTLIELLIVIAIIAILAVVVLLALNPAELLRQSRDANRVSDMATLTNALNLYTTDQAGSQSFSMGIASDTYFSIFDPTATSTAGDQCQGLNMLSLNTSVGQSWQCASSSTYRSVNTTGWLPVNLISLSAGSPIGSLPIDPTNQTSSGLFYAYNTNGNQFEVTADLESSKYKAQYGQTPQTSLFPEIISGGTPTVSALYNPSGLVGYWPMDEGSGSSTQDLSGNSNIGTWSGTPAGTSGYYSGGKVGSWAGYFNGSSDMVSIPDTASLDLSSALSVSLWLKTSGGMAMDILTKSTTSPNYSMDITGKIRFFGYEGATPVGYTTGVGNILNDGIWHYVVGTYDGSFFKLYEDGALVASGGAVGNLSTNANALQVGYRPAVGFFLGSIDDVRIYNRALSAAEIQAMYNAEK